MFKKRKKIRAAGSGTRLTILILVFLGLTFAMVQKLFTLQIINGENYLNNFAVSITKTRTLPSTRGEIFDCNGNLLAYNQLTYVVTFEDSGSYETTHQRNLSLNSILYRTIQIIESHGDSVKQDFRIALNDKGEYEYTATGFNLSRFKADIFGQPYIDDLTDEQLNMSAPKMVELLSSTKYYGLVDPKTTEAELLEYGLPREFTPEETLQLLYLRTQLSQNSFQRYNAITVAEDVCDMTVSQLMENKAELYGLDVVEDYKRVYNNAEYFAQIIGYTGQVSSEELGELKEKNSAYDSNDIVGKVGLEKVMETSLHGDKGSETIYVDNVGHQLSVQSRVDPQAGDSLYLTIDSDLQEAVYRMLEQYIAGIVYSHIADTEEMNTDWLTSSDDVFIPVYDVYFSLFENNVLSVDHLSKADASVNEAHVHQLFLQKCESIFSEIRSQLTTDDPTPYRDLTEEMQVYQSYIVNTMLPATGILNLDAIDKTDLTYLAWAQEETLSLQEYLTYAISKNWIDINGIVDDTVYMDAAEIYSALADYIQTYLTRDMDFCKRVFRYMLREGSLSGTEVCLLLFDQGILEMDEESYNSLSSGGSAYDFIREKIYNLEITPAQLALMPCSGAVVITDPNTGEVKACVSYPGYDNNRLVNDMDTAYYNKLVTDLSSPFYSRATQEVLAPGSTYKPITAAAGVMEGQVGLEEPITCTGEFEEVDPTVKCWAYPGMHLAETLTEALRDSCNYYFNTVGYRLSSVEGNYVDEVGISTLSKYASMFGFDSRSGVEVPETAPQMATYDAVRTAMGQSNNAFTVTQIARYVSTIANGGTCYDLTLINKVTDSNGNIIQSHEPVVHSTVDIPDYLWSSIHSGMRAMVQRHSAFTDYSGVAIAGKTGTAQEVITKPAHALFIGYAPYEEPTMAIAVRMANGYTSANAATLARDVISYYFETADRDTLIPGHAIEVATNDTIAD